MKQIARICVAIVLAGVSLSAFAGGINVREARKSVDFNTPYPFYIGASVGYGSTDWSMLTALPGQAASSVSPVSADDTGVTGGFMVGYQFSKMFAFEFSYSHFPRTTLKFDPWSIYWNNDVRQDDDPITRYLHTDTDAFGFVGKFIVPVRDTDSFFAFASAGLGIVHRSFEEYEDIFPPTNHVGATFGVGMIFVINRHLTAETAFQYYTGYGKAADGPVIKYVPFLYQGYIDLAYHFSF